MSYRAIASFIVALCSLAAPAQAGQPIGLEARLANPVMKGGEAGKNYLKVALQGCKPEPSQSRMPVNVAFVIDRSGSMQGMPIAQAREAAVMAVNRLLPTDIASVVIFDNRIDVLAPAQPVADPAHFADLIRQVGARGSTAIHGGVLAGAAEVAKNRDARRLNRVVLLSDGQANVGPSRPEEFAALGRLLLSQGISVSTIGLGLGYNEDLMLQLARASDGNHAFAREPTDLVQIFNKEFDDVLGSCAQTVSIDIELKAGIKPVRALSRDGTIEGQRASFTLNQVYAATEHYVLLEVELDKSQAGATEQELGLVKVAYTAPDTGARQALEATVRGRFSDLGGRGEGRLRLQGCGGRCRAGNARARAARGRAAGSGQDQGGTRAAAAECERDRQPRRQHDALAAHARSAAAVPGARCAGSSDYAGAVERRPQTAAPARRGNGRLGRAVLSGQHPR